MMVRADAKCKVVDRLPLHPDEWCTYVYTMITSVQITDSGPKSTYSQTSRIFSTEMASIRHLTSSWRRATSLLAERVHQPQDAHAYLEGMGRCGGGEGCNGVIREKVDWGLTTATLNTC
jgi:hypothetical protein